MRIKYTCFHGFKIRLGGRNREVRYGFRQKAHMLLPRASKESKENLMTAWETNYAFIYKTKKSTVQLKSEGHISCSFMP